MISIIACLLCGNACSLMLGASMVMLFHLDEVARSGAIRCCGRFPDVSKRRSVRSTALGYALLGAALNLLACYLFARVL